MGHPAPPLHSQETLAEAGERLEHRGLLRAGVSSCIPSRPETMEQSQRVCVALAKGECSAAERGCAASAEPCSPTERYELPCPLLRACFQPWLCRGKVSRAGTAAPWEVWHVAIGPDRRNASSFSSECRAGHTSCSHPSGEPPSPTIPTWDWGQVDLKPPRSCQTPLGCPQAPSVGSPLGKPAATSEATKAIAATCLDAIACADTCSV